MIDSDRLRTFGAMLLGEQSADEKHRVLASLAEAGPGALLVLPELVACQYNPDIDVSNHAAETIRGIGVAAIPVLARLVETPDENAAAWIDADTLVFRSYAANALADFGEPAIDSLKKLMQSSDEEAVEAAIGSCDRAGTSALNLLPILESFIKGSEHSAAAAEALLMMLLKFVGAEKEAVREFIFDQLNGPASLPKLSILEAIYFLESDPASARAILEKLALNSDKEVAVRACELLNGLQLGDTT